jgi:hypothetical protein
LAGIAIVSSFVSIASIGFPAVIVPAILISIIPELERDIDLG